MHSPPDRTRAWPLIPPLDGGSLLVLAVLPVLLLAPFLSGHQVLYYRDLALASEPQVSFARNSILSGQMPLWNPLLGGGFPQWAGMEPPFLSPFTILFIWIGFPMATSWNLVLHLVLAGWGTYALGRELGWRRAAALLAALSFSSGGFLTSLTNLYSELVSAALLPLVHLTYYRVCRQPSSRNWLAAIAALAWHTASNRPDMSVLTLLFLATLALHRTGHELHYRPLLRLGVITGAALLANAATVLPALEFIRHSNRQMGLPLEEATLFSLPPLALLQFLFPSFFGNPEWIGDWGRYFVGEPAMSYDQLHLSLYAGMGAYLLAGFALATRRPLVPLLATWALLALWLTLGRWGFLFSWLHQLPLLALFRYPAKFLLLWNWALVLLAGIGADAWLRNPHQGRRYFTTAFACGLLALAILAPLYLSTSSWAPWLSRLDWSAWTTGPPDRNLRSYLMDVFPRAAPGVVLACLIPLLFWTVLAGLARWIGHGADHRYATPAQPQPLANAVQSSPTPYLLIISLLALVAWDLLLQARPIIFAASPDLFDRVPQTVQFLRHREAPASLYRLDQGLEPFQQDPARFLDWIPQGSVSWQETLTRWLREGLFPFTPMSYGIADTSQARSNLMPDHSIHDLLKNVFEFYSRISRSPVPPTIAGLMNVKYIQFIRVPPPGKPLSEPPWARHNPRLRLLLRNERTGVLLYENRTCRPRAFFVPEAVVVPSLSAAARLLASPHLAWHHRVVLTADPALQQTLTIRAARRGRMPAVQPRCQILEYRNQFVRVAFASPESGYLVLSDNYYPGWSVTVDAQPRPLLQANAVVRAVWVEAGTHDVVFRYRPRSWWIGALLSSLAILAGLTTTWRVIFK